MPGCDRSALKELMEHTKAGEPHLLRHYFYFPKETRAQKAAVELRRQGFHTDVRPIVDGLNHLILASHRIIPSEAAILAGRRLMSTIVKNFQCEYDGWDAEVK